MTNENNGKVIRLEDLGICTCCGTLVTIEDPLSLNWKCPNPKCNNTLNNKDFGFQIIDEKWQRFQWVGRGGKWVQRRPIEDFYLNGLKITVEKLPGYYSCSGR